MSLTIFGSVEILRIKNVYLFHNFAKNDHYDDSNATAPIKSGVVSY